MNNTALGAYALTTLEPFALEQFLNVPYSPAFLLHVSFDVAIMHHPKYIAATECGFDSYFDGMYELADGETFVFCPRSYTASEVILEVTRNLKPDPRLSVQAWNVGFTLGWLSALALTDRPLALQGLALLTALAAGRSTHVG